MVQERQGATCESRGRADCRGGQAYQGSAKAGEEAVLWWERRPALALSHQLEALRAPCCGTCVEGSSLSILLPRHCVISPVCLSGLMYLMGRGARKSVLFP